MRYGSLVRAGLFLALAACVVGGASCNRRVVRRVAGNAAEEAAYEVLRQALVAAKITSADRFLDAVWIVVDRRDQAGGAAVFAAALKLQNARVAQKYTAAQVINLMRLAEPGVRRASPRVAHGLRGLYSYVDSH